MDIVNVRKEIEIDYEQFEALISEHVKDMKRQKKMNMGIPKKVIAYEFGEHQNLLGLRYEY